MELAASISKASKASPRQRAPNEVVELIRKLRWIGEEDEARKLGLKLRDSPQLSKLLTTPDAVLYETD